MTALIQEDRACAGRRANLVSQRGVMADLVSTSSFLPPCRTLARPHATSHPSALSFSRSDACHDMISMSLISMSLISMSLISMSLISMSLISMSLTSMSLLSMSLISMPLISMSLISMMSLISFLSMSLISFLLSLGEKLRFNHLGPKKVPRTAASY